MLAIVLQAMVVYAPPLNRIFHTVPIPAASVMSIAAAASLVLWVEELRKLRARLT